MQDNLNKKDFLSLKKEIMDILEDIITVEEHKNYLEISLPIFLDNSFRINLFLDKEHQILYNNLYVTLENSICRKLKKEKNIIKDFLNNEKEFPEIRKTLIEFGIDSDSLTLDYKIKDKTNLAKEILTYSELIKKYYNNIYNIVLYRFGTNKEKKQIYYENFSKIIKEFKGKNKFEEIEYSGLSGTPIFSNKNITVAASKDFDTLTQFYIDLEDIGDVFKNKKGFIFCNNYKKNSAKANFLKKKIEKKKINIVTFVNIKTEKELRKEIENNLNAIEEN